MSVKMNKNFFSVLLDPAPLSQLWRAYKKSEYVLCIRFECERQLENHLFCIRIYMIHICGRCSGGTNSLYACYHRIFNIVYTNHRDMYCYFSGVKPVRRFCLLPISFWLVHHTSAEPYTHTEQQQQQRRIVYPIEHNKHSYIAGCGYIPRKFPLHFTENKHAYTSNRGGSWSHCCRFASSSFDFRANNETIRMVTDTIQDEWYESIFSTMYTTQSDIGIHLDIKKFFLCAHTHSFTHWWICKRSKRKSSTNSFTTTTEKKKKKVYKIENTHSILSFSFCIIVVQNFLFSCSNVWIWKWISSPSHLIAYFQRRRSRHRVALEIKRKRLFPMYIFFRGCVFPFTRRI